jgi:hypothetical protein
MIMVSLGVRGGRCRGTAPEWGEGLFPDSAPWGGGTLEFFLSSVKPETVERFVYVAVDCIS